MGCEVKRGVWSVGSGAWALEHGLSSMGSGAWGVKL